MTFLADTFGDCEGGLGDIICTADEVQRAMTAVTQLANIWASVGYDAKFQAAVKAIVDKGQQLGTGPTSWCEWKALGLQAQALTAQIGQAHNIATPAPTLSPGASAAAGEFFKGLLTLGAVGVGGWLLFTLLKGRGT